jgi:hypothetical protein
MAKGTIKMHVSEKRWNGLTNMFFIKHTFVKKILYLGVEKMKRD